MTRTLRGGELIAKSRRTIARHFLPESVFEQPKWVAKGFWAIVDQALFAGANFLLNIVLARWLSVEEYGAFAVAYSIFLLLGAFHTSFLTEPMLVFGAGKYNDRWGEYLGVLTYGHWVFGIVTGLVLAAAGAFFFRDGAGEIGQALVGLAIASPFILLLWLTRRAFYVQSRPEWSALGGVLYMALMLAGIYALYVMQCVSAFGALVVMGLASCLVSTAFVMKLKPKWRISLRDAGTREMIRNQWTYARWSAGTTVLTWIPGNIYYSLLPVWTGLAGAAALRALMNLAMPILHANSALSVLLLPHFAKAVQFGGGTALKREVKRSQFVLVASAVAFWLLLLCFGYQLVQLLYGNRYIEYAEILPIIGLLPISAAVVAVLGAALRALERPHIVFWCYVASSVFTFTGGLGLAFVLGVQGAAFALFLSSLTTAVGMVVSFYFVGKKQGGAQ